MLKKIIILKNYTYKSENTYITLFHIKKILTLKTIYIKIILKRHKSHLITPFHIDDSHK